MSLSRALACALFASASLAPFASAQTVFVVSRFAGPGVFSTEIQPAVDAASDGDIVVVRPAPFPGYAGFTVAGKSLVVTSDGTGATNVGGGATITGIGAGQFVVLRGLILFGLGPSLPLVVHQCDGAVWLEDDVIHTLLGFGPATTVVQAASVLIQRSTMFGAATNDGGVVTAWPGLAASNCTLALFDVETTGGNSFNGPQAQPGAPGLLLDGAVLYASGSDLKGGKGATFWLDAANPLHGTQGGPGLLLGNGAVADLLGCGLVGGAGGPGIPPGRPGESIGGSGANTLAGSPRHFEATSPVLEGAFTTWRFQGDPIELVGVLISFAPAPTAAPVVPGLSAPLLVDLAGVLPIFVGVTDAGGGLVENFPIGELPPGMRGAVLYVQSFFLGPFAGALGPAAVLVILDSAT